MPRVFAQPVTFPGRDDAIRLGGRFVAMQARLLSNEVTGLGSRQLAGVDALPDARALILLRLVEDGRLGPAGEDGCRKDDGEHECFT